MSIYLKKFLMEDLNAKHNSRTKGYSIKINDREFKFKSIDEIVEKIIGSKTKFANNVNWQNHKLTYNDDYQKWDNNLPEDIKKALINIMTAKTISSKQFNSEAGTVFDSYSKTVTQLPTMGFNLVDKKILKNIRYCKEDNSIYVLKNNRLRLIGQLPQVQKDPSINELCNVIQENIGIEFNEGVPVTIDWYIKECISRINFQKQHLIDECQLLQDSGTEWEAIQIEIGEDVIFKPSKYNSGNYVNSLELAVDNFCFENFWEMVPGSLFSSKIIEIKSLYTDYPAVSPNGEQYKIKVWNNFFYNMVRSGEALTEFRYLKNIFSEFVTYIKDDPYFRLEEMPRTYSASEKEVGLFNYSMENLKNNICKDSYKTIEECKNIMLFKSWMNPSEFKFAMAWAYAAIHPVTIPSNIALLLWTGGGTGKSSFVAMIKEAMKMATNAKDSEIYFEIKGNKFDEDPRNWIPDGELGVEKAALINIDEATTDSINLYKNFSGSAAGNKLNIRKNYENARSVDIYGKFIFTTNQQLSLSSDDGSLLRRVAIISHGEIRNVIGTDKILSNREIVEEYRKQIPMLMKIGKECYEQIIAEGFSSIDEYAMKVNDINKNLKESTSTCNNIDYYRILWSKLEENTNYKDAKTNKGCYKLQGGALKTFYVQICDENGSDMKYYSSFRKFIIERQELFVEKNVCKAARGYILNKDKQIHQFKKGCNAVYHLYPLKDEYKMVIDEDDDEETSDDIVNRLDEDLEYDENGEIKVDVDYTNRPYEDVVKDIIDPMLECNLWK